MRCLVISESKGISGDGPQEHACATLVYDVIPCLIARPLRLCRYCSCCCCMAGQLHASWQSGHQLRFQSWLLHKQCLQGSMQHLLPWKSDRQSMT